MGMIKSIFGFENTPGNRRQFDIIGALWREDRLSRQQLSRELNTSKVSISQNVDKLLARGLIIENEAIANERGRRPIPLSLKRDLFYSVGVCLTNDIPRISLLDANSKVLLELELNSSQGAPWREKRDNLAEGVQKLLRQANAPLAKVIGLGVTLPGYMNPSSGEILYSSAFPDAEKFNIIDYFKQRFPGQSCYIINTAHLIPFLEHRWWGAAAMSSFLMVHARFGLGMFLNGRLYRGHQCRAGELGKMQLQTTGEASTDGRVGTLDRLAPLYKITNKLEDIIAAGGKTAVNKYLVDGADRVTLEMALKAVEDGDQLCAQMFSEHFEIVARAVTNLAYLFNPEAIFLPYWTARCPDISLAIVKRMMGHYGVSDWELKTEILAAQCKDDDYARGAALLPLEYLFGNSKLGEADG